MKNPASFGGFGYNRQLSYPYARGRDAAAARWCRRFGALPLLDDLLKLVLPLATIEAALGRH